MKIFPKINKWTESDETSAESNPVQCAGELLRSVREEVSPDKQQSIDSFLNKVGEAPK